MTNTFFTYYFFYYIFTNNIYKTLPEMAVVTTLFKSVTKRQIIVMKQLSPLKIVFFSVCNQNNIFVAVFCCFLKFGCDETQVTYLPCSCLVFIKF